MRNEDATARAADLAEQILDEVSGAEQDWSLVEQRALELAELAAVVARPATRSEDFPGDP